MLGKKLGNFEHGHGCVEKVTRFFMLPIAVFISITHAGLCMDSTDQRDVEM